MTWPTLERALVIAGEWCLAVVLGVCLLIAVFVVGIAVAFTWF